METEASRYNLVQQGSGLSKKDFAESLGISNDGDMVIFNTKQTVTLISANDEYKSRRYSRYKIDAIRVAGRVVACYHRV